METGGKIWYHRRGQDPRDSRSPEACEPRGKVTSWGAGYGLWKSLPPTPHSISGKCYTVGHGILGRGRPLRFGWETFKQRAVVLSSGRPSSSCLPRPGQRLHQRDRCRALPARPKIRRSSARVINLALGTLLSMGATAFYLAAHDNPDTPTYPCCGIRGRSGSISGRRSCLRWPSPSDCVLLIVPGIILRLDVHVLDLHRHRARASVRSMR